jgi:choline kinase
MLRTMISCGNDFAVAVDDNWKHYWFKRYGTIYFDTESLVINGDGHIVSMGMENPPIEKIDARYIGLLKFSKEGLSKIIEIWERDTTKYRGKPWQQSGRPISQSYMTDLLNALIQYGYSVKAVRFNNGWIEFDTNKDYENALQWIADGSIKDLFSVT